MFQRILTGLLFAVVGVGIIYYSTSIVDFLGKLQRAEEKLGGTRKLYIYLGFFLCFVGFLYIFGVLGPGEMDKTINTGFGTGNIGTGNM